MNKYLNTAPVIDPKEYAKYIEILDSQIKQKNIYNIGIIGPYGAGKSSLIGSYLKKTRKKNCIISLSNFNSDCVDVNSMTNNNGENGENTSKKIVINSNFKNTGQKTIHTSRKLNNDVEAQIEKSILQQMLFSEKSGKLANSKLNRIGNRSLISTFLLSLLVLSTIFSFCTAFWHFASNNYNWKHSGFLVLMGVFFFLLFFIIFYFVFKRYKVNSIKLKDIEAEFENEKSFILNKFLDEILYFFSKTKKKIVVFEDLDRFDSLDIFIKLREINQIINKSKIVRQKVTFIYCIKDSLFQSKYERAKFFEYVMTLIPILSQNNVEEILIKINNDLEPLIKLDENYIHKISIFIEDFRLLKNVFNDYMLYCEMLHDNFQNTNLNKNKLFSLMIYKNLHPSEFALLQQGKGYLVEIFNKKNLFDKLLQEINDKINQKAAEKEKIIKVYFDNFEIIKTIMKGTIHMYGSRFYGSFSGMQNIDSIKEINFNENTKYYYTHNGYNYTCDLKQIIEYNKKIDLHFLYDVSINSKEKIVANITSEIDSLNEEKNQIKTYSIKKLIEVFESDIIEFDDSITKYFIANGYIEEDFLDYIVLSSNLFLTHKDKKFISSVLLNEENDFQNEIDNIVNVIEFFDDEYFGSKYILNLYIINEMYNNAKVSNKKSIFEKYIKRCNESEIRKFFILYLNKYCIDDFVKYIIEQRIDLVSNIIKNDNMIFENRKQQLILEILSFDIGIIMNYEEECKISKIVSYNKDYLKQIRIENENLKNTLLELNMKFSDISNISYDLFNFIFDNALFEINKVNLDYIFEKLKLNKGIIMLKGQKAWDYIEINFLKYIEALGDVKEFNEESPETLYLIKKYKDELDYKNVISKIKTRFDFLEDLDNDIVSLLFECYLIIPDWEILNKYYINYDIKREQLVNFIVNNYNDLSMTTIDNLEISSFILEQKDIRIEKVLSSIKDNIYYSQKISYSNETLKVLTSNEKIIFKEYYGIERYYDVFASLITPKNHLEILEQIGYNIQFLYYLLKNEKYNEFVKGYIKKFETKIMEEEIIDIEQFLNKLSLLTDNIRVMLLSQDNIDYGTIYLIIHFINDKQTLKSIDMLGKIFKDYDFENVLKKGQMDVTIQEIKNILSLLKEYDVLEFRRSTNGKTYRNIKIK